MLAGTKKPSRFLEGARSACCFLLFLLCRCEIVSVPCLPFDASCNMFVAELLRSSAKSEAGGSFACADQTFCYFYISGSLASGAFGGPTGGDTHCQNTRPAGLPAGTYQAVLMTDNASRNMANDWVLKPQTEYRRPDGTTIIGVTNAAAVFSVATGNLTSSPDSTLVSVWTGIRVNGEELWEVQSGNTCLDWTTGPGPSGYYGSPIDTTYAAFDLTTQACNTTGYLYCAQQ